MPDAAPNTPEARENHRVRMAREKRERMHTHLLRSVMAVCSGDQSSGPKVIDDVVHHAEVSRGTFYKHFSSLEEAIAELGANLAEEMTIGISSVYDVLDDPRERLATGFQLFLRRTIFDPHWGGFVAHVELLDPKNEMVRHMAADIQLGIDRGQYDLPNYAEGLTLLLGTKIEAIRRTIREHRGPDYACQMAALILRGLGTAPMEAARIAGDMSRRLDREGPLHLDWWASAQPQ